jgi:hypothetical protein
MTQRAWAAAMWLLCASSLFAQTRNPLEGVWRISEVVTPAGNPAAKGVEVWTKDRQLPSVVIFTRRYFSRLEENRSRSAVAPPKDPQNLTDSEKLASYEQWRPFTAQSGTYDLQGSTLSLHVIVAKNVSPKPVSRAWELKFEGPDAFWMIPTPDRAATEPRMKLTRLE